MAVWFTSDTHYSHKKILEFCPVTRPFTDIGEMNRHLIAQWQALVQPEDDVWMLGDIFWCDAGKAMNIMDQLPGQKNLVLGNHDQVIRNHVPLQNKFDSIHDYKELKIDGKFVVLCHYPLARWNRGHYGSYMLHGHEHGSYLDGGRILDVGIDGELTQNCAPVAWNAIVAHMEQRPVTVHH